MILDNPEDSIDDDMTPFDHSVTEISELKDIWKTTRSAQLKLDIRNYVIRTRSAQTIWNKRSQKYVPDVDHFKRFVAAHNENAKRIKQLLGGELKY